MKKSERELKEFEKISVADVKIVLRPDITECGCIPVIVQWETALGSYRSFRQYDERDLGWWLGALLNHINDDWTASVIVSVQDDVDGVVSEVSSERSDDWFDLYSKPTAHDSGIGSGERASQLAFINSKRSMFQGPLDPEASGWTDDDILIEAVALGWVSTK